MKNKFRIDNYDQALDYLYSFINYETRRTAAYNPEHYNLARMKMLLSKLHFRQHGRLIHIAGTKGKGTTAAALEAILRAHGRCTGLFTSPHIRDVRERFRYNGMPIDKDEFISLCRRLADAQMQMPDDMQATTFELFTALAFLYFNDKGVEDAVIEVGMGGRLDSTNVISPAICIITSISYDHMDKLGTSLAAIAAEKAGIIKPGIPVVSAYQKPQADAVIREKTKGENAPLIVYGGEGFNARSIRSDVSGIRFSYAFATGGEEELSCPLIGEHQAENLCLALRAAEVLMPLKPEVCRNALGSLHILGRMEVIQSSPLIILDGAHNRDSMEKTLHALSQLGGGLSPHILFAPLADKDIEGMAAAMKGRVRSLIVSMPHTHKTVDMEKTIRIVGGMGIPYRAENNFRRALEILFQGCRDERAPGLITGSLYSVASYHKMKDENQI